MLVSSREVVAPAIGHLGHEQKAPAVLNVAGYIPHHGGAWAAVVNLDAEAAAEGTHFEGKRPACGSAVGDGVRGQLRGEQPGRIYEVFRYSPRL
jgi:hypothetical protein